MAKIWHFISSETWRRELFIRFICNLREKSGVLDINHLETIWATISMSLRLFSEDVHPQSRKSKSEFKSRPFPMTRS
jgi:hypothetical protein